MAVTNPIQCRIRVTAREELKCERAIKALKIKYISIQSGRIISTQMAHRNNGG